MTATIIPFRPADAPRIDVTRAATVVLMAEVLFRTNTFANIDAAFETLRAWGFPASTIAMCIDDARQAAAQRAVAREMSAP